jgi:TM2 domain-containing membrane protein YozV
MNAIETTNEIPNRTQAATLAFLLGCLGVHKFYLGRIGLGLLSVYFCWTLIPAIVGFVEGIALLKMSDEAFAQKYSQA